jgi:hypothetical protein
MGFTDSLLMSLGLLLGIYLIYKLLFAKKKIDTEYDNLYDRVLNSKEYKVKGQYDK